MADEIHVRHDEGAQRFVIELAADEAVMEYQRPDAGTIDIYHTFVPTSGRGQGLAGKLAKAAMEYAREHGLEVVPTCPYIPGYLERHPEYADLTKRP